MKKYLAILAVCLSVTACADHADRVQAAYVSPIQYQDFSCKQIRSELMRVSRKVNEISGAQDKQASNDAVAMGVGLVIFWPALFFISGHDQHIELADLKGQYDALEEAAIQKNCDVAMEIQEAKKMAAERSQQQQQSVKKEMERTND
jgi:hypothetical protein